MFIVEKIKKNKLDDQDLDLETFLTLKEDKKIVAFGRIKSKDEIHQIASLWVDPKSRGKKLGYKIMKALIKKYKLLKIYAVCKEELSEYYEKFGFKQLKIIPKELKIYNEFCKREKIKPAYLVYNRKKIETDKSFSQIPDLIIIDGGKGQLSSALKAIKNAGVDKLGIATCALAKKQEEIFLPGKATSIILPRNSQALYLIQRIRDEAHRFAHDFNRSSHAKKLVKSQLDMIPGVGTVMKRKLLKTFGSIQNIKDAPLEELIKCCGEYLATKLKENL